MTSFDYNAPAEVFASSGQGRRRRPVIYRRFGSGAEAVQFAIEHVPAPLLAGIVLESEEDRFDRLAIQSLYDSSEYPLVRNASD